MASNPMQRQKRVSFLLGFLTMLLLSAIVIGFLGYTLYKIKEEEKAEKNAMKDVYVISTDVPSGGAINSTVMKLQKVAGTVAPSNRFTSSNLLDEEGNPREDLVSKIDLKAGTVLTADMVTINSEKATSDLRKQEYNIATLPTEIQTGDYVDIRIRMASGADYIIVSKKQVTIPQVAGMDAAETFTVNLAEEETLAMSSAIIDAFTCIGSEIYLTIYTDPGMQVAATPTYHVSATTMQLIGDNPNIVTDAKNALYNRYYQNGGERERNVIQNEINSNSEDAKDNIETNIEEHITKQKEYRQQYLEALAGGGV